MNLACFIQLLKLSRYHHPLAEFLYLCMLMECVAYLVTENRNFDSLIIICDRMYIARIEEQESRIYIFFGLIFFCNFSFSVSFGLIASEL